MRILTMLAEPRRCSRGLAACLAVLQAFTGCAAAAADGPPVTTYTYDEARSGAFNTGRLTSITEDGITIRMDYDANGSTIRKAWASSGQTWEHGFSYAPSGHLIQRTFSGATATGSPSSTAAVGTNPTPGVVNYQYDGFGRVSAVPGLVTSVTYHVSGQPRLTTYPNGVTETRSYDAGRMWLTGITTTGPEAGAGGTVLFTESYTRNAKGLITSVTSNRPYGNWTYAYDSVDRLTQITNRDSADFSQSFTYDAADNVTFNSAVGSYTYPAPTGLRPHAVTKAGSQTYSYDTRGNMISGGGRTVTYDGLDRPVSITRGGVVTTFSYGPDGARVKKVSGGQTTVYLGADEEITPEGRKIRHPHAGVREVDGTLNWLQSDHLASVRLMTNGSGAVIAENHYRPYGQRTELLAKRSICRVNPRAGSPARRAGQSADLVRALRCPDRAGRPGNRPHLSQRPLWSLSPA